MSAEQIRRVAAEPRLDRGRPIAPDLEGIRAAILVEDVFGITLRDEEMVPELLTAPGMVERLVRRERGDR
jgi:hypothetical protein